MHRSPHLIYRDVSHSLLVFTDELTTPSADSSGSNGSAQLKLVEEVGITVEVDSAERQSVPLFKGLDQHISVSEGQYVGIASGDGPMNLAVTTHAISETARLLGMFLRDCLWLQRVGDGAPSAGSASGGDAADPGFWYSNVAVPGGPTVITLDHWGAYTYTTPP